MGSLKEDSSPSPGENARKTQWLPNIQKVKALITDSWKQEARGKAAECKPITLQSLPCAQAYADVNRDAVLFWKNEQR